MQVVPAVRTDRPAGLLFAVGALSMIGVPGTMGFLAKYGFAQAALAEQGKLLPAILALAVSTLLNTCYFGRAILQIYAKPEQPTAFAAERRGRASFLSATGLLCAANLALGLHAQPLLGLLKRGLALMDRT